MSDQSDRGSVTQKHALFLTPTLCVFESQAKVPRPVTRSSLIGNFRLVFCGRFRSRFHFSPSCSVIHNIIYHLCNRCSSTIIGPSVTAAMSNVIMTGQRGRGLGVGGMCGVEWNGGVWDA